MKWFICSLLVIFSSIAFAQQKASRATIENPSADELRYNRIFHKQIRPKEQAYAKRSRFLNDPKYQTGPFPSQHDKKALNKYVIGAQKILGRISSESLKGYCAEINQLRKSINAYSTDACRGLESRITSLNNKIAKARKYLKKKQDENTKDTENQDVLASLELDTNSARQSANREEDALLAILNNNKEKSLDDFLADRGRNTKSAIYDPLADVGTTPSNSGDPLAGLMDTAPEKQDTFKIDYKNGMVGVISSLGEILIPYKAWSILDYDDGIAKVRTTIKGGYKCSIDSELDIGSQGTHSASQTGFVDIEGEFIDGSTLSFEFNAAHTLYLTQYKTRSHFDTEEQYQAYRRKVARVEAREKVAYQKCKREAALWKQGIARRYR